MHILCIKNQLTVQHYQRYINYTTLHMTILIFFIFFYHVFLKQNVEKRGRRDVPGPLKKVPGLLDLLSPGTKGPWDLQGIQVLSCPVLSRDLPGTSRDGTVLLESLVYSAVVRYEWYAIFEPLTIDLEKELFYFSFISKATLRIQK